MATPVQVRKRDLTPHKATVAPLLHARTVLTKSPWEFVSLWLTREKNANALFYWDQARRFAVAAAGMPLSSAPLLHYYSFMNAAKALLTAKRISFDEIHGVGSKNMRSQSSRIDLSNEGVQIRKKGILPSLAIYLGDTELASTHSLKELLFNLPFVHRTYCLTYMSQRDLFYSLTDCTYMFDRSTGEVYLTAQLSKDFTHKSFLKKLPPSFILDTNAEKPPAIRSKATRKIAGPNLAAPADIRALQSLNKELRTDLQYIAGSQTLWYVKAIESGPKRLSRSPLTITLAVMHRLSEICRYQPLKLAAFLRGQRNWLLSEFVLMAPEQFLDGIASELTGYQFLLPNVRQPA